MKELNTLQKIAVVFGILGFISLPFTIYRHQKYLKNKTRVDYNLFRNASICGRIKNVDGTVTGAHILIEDSETEYTFVPLTLPQKNGITLSRKFSKGDSICKKSGSDTVYFYSKGKEYLYTYKRFE